MSKVALITGNDTGVGKTRVAASLAKLLADFGPVRYLKVVETGIVQPIDSDANQVSNWAKGELESSTVLRSYRQPLAPVFAAASEGEELAFRDLVEEFQKAKGPNWNLAEGAGGMAVPLDSSGVDWKDFAKAIPVDAVVLVVENRLGAINQMRLLDAYCQDLSIPCGFWLNEALPQEIEVIRTNEKALSSLARSTWGIQRHGKEPAQVDLSWANEESDA